MRACLMFAVLAVAVPDRQDPTPKGAPPLLEQIRGEWKIEKLLIGGQLTATPANLRITDTDMIIEINGQPSPADGFTSPYTIDVTKTPAAFAFTRTKHHGILKMEGERLIMCVSLGGDRPPTDFSPMSPGLTIYLLDLRRVAK